MPKFRYYPRGCTSPDGLRHLSIGEYPGQMLAEPWKYYIPQFRVAPHIWYVAGEPDICSYIIDTGDGLILIDCPAFQTLYLQLENIRRAGFDPMTIKHIFISHAHCDHYGGVRAMKEYTGATVWMSEDDTIDLKKRLDAGKKDQFFDVHDWSVDKFYDFSAPFVLGNMSFTFRLCPGHSAGAIAMFFDDVDTEGTVYHIGMHGGCGASASTEALKKMGYPIAWHKQFIDDCYDMADIPVDILLANHENQTNFYAGINHEDRTDFSGFVDKNLWRETMISRAENVRGLG